MKTIYNTLKINQMYGVWGGGNVSQLFVIKQSKLYEQSKARLYQFCLGFFMPI